jgi:hypothetical protein
MIRTGKKLIIVVNRQRQVKYTIIPDILPDLPVVVVPKKTFQQIFSQLPDDLQRHIFSFLGGRYDETEIDIMSIIAKGFRTYNYIIRNWDIYTALTAAKIDKNMDSLSFPYAYGSKPSKKSSKNTKTMWVKSQLIKEYKNIIFSRNTPLSVLLDNTRNNRCFCVCDGYEEYVSHELSTLRRSVHNIETVKFASGR